MQRAWPADAVERRPVASLLPCARNARTQTPLLTYTIGMLLVFIVHPASVQDRDGVEPLPRQARRLFPFVERIIGDAGYQGPKMAAVFARTCTRSASRLE